MRKKLLLLGLVVILTLAMCACESTLTSNPEEETGKTASSDSYAAATSVKYYTCTVFEKTPDKVDTVSFQVGKGVTVIVCSNQTTGFQWSEAEIEDTSILEQVSHEYTPPVGDKVGAAGQEKFFFRGIKTGTTTVYMEYSQPWDGGEKAAWTCSLTVTVK
jgi:predicted secreted protein